MLADPLLAVCAAAFAAGLTDAVVGGGGLIQLPALLIVFPHLRPIDLLGTNKLAAVFGTTAAMTTYVRRVPLDWRLTGVSAATAFVFSRVGAQMVGRVSASEFKPAMLTLLLAMAAFTFWRRDFGADTATKARGAAALALGALIGAALGFYDGFFGPGTGSILIFAFIGAIGLDFLRASATSKVVNVCTNAGALVYFVASGHILYRYALPMAACNMAGGIIGARLAIARGNRFVRGFFIAVILGVIARYGADVLQGR